MFIILSLVWVLASCIDRIPLETEGTVDLLVIEGSINNGPGPYTVTIKRSGDFSEDQLAIQKPIAGAQVRIVAETGEFSPMTEIDPGIYQTSDLSFRGEPGNTYYVEATLDEGRTYRSIPEKLQPVPRIDGIFFDTFQEDRLNSNNVIIERDFIRFLVNTSIPDDTENRYFKWNFSGEYVFTEVPDPENPLDPVRQCYLTDIIDLNKIVIFNGLEAEANNLTEEIFVTELDNKFRTTYCFHLYQQSLTREAYEFWEEVGTLVNRTGSLFEVPPGRIRGNIVNVNEPDEEVLGYFYVTSIDSLRFFFQRRNVPDIIIPNPCRDAEPESFPECFDCQLFPGSTLERPPYWEN